MNTYYELIKHIRTVFEEDVNVSTITTEDNYNIIDNYKKNLYPLVHLNVINSPYNQGSSAVTTYEVEINVLDIRDITKIEISDKFWHNDNRHDNWNTTRAILKKFENKMYKDHLDTDITLSTASGATPVTYEFSNLLDGWTQIFTIEVPDQLTTVC